MWYIHLVASNLNWLFSVCCYTLGIVYQISIYLAHDKPSEHEHDIPYLILLAFVYVVYVWLAYHTDSQRKHSFCVNSLLSYVTSDYWITYVNL